MHSNIQTANAVLYKGIYKNIDLKVYGIGKQIEYDWSVKPGGNPGDIRFEYKSVKGTRIDGEDNIIVATHSSELVHKAPFSYQYIGDEKVEVKAGFKKIDKNTYGFKVGTYDKGRELIIDPIVVDYSTYLGGSADDNGKGIAVDISGNAYVVGETKSRDFPIICEYQGDPNQSIYDYNAVVTKINAFPISPLAVTTLPVSSISSTYASGGGEVISDGGSSVTASGKREKKIRLFASFFSSILRVSSRSSRLFLLLVWAFPPVCTGYRALPRLSWLYSKQQAYNPLSFAPPCSPSGGTFCHPFSQIPAVPQGFPF